MSQIASSLQPEIKPPALLAAPSKLFVEVTTRCNLNCAMCVKQAPGNSIGDNHMDSATFARLEPALGNLQALFLNGIGEPLLHPDLENFIRRARRLLPSAASIGFQSNGLLLTEQRAASLGQAGLSHICLSVDGATPETFRQVRQGGELDGIQRAFAALTSLRETAPTDCPELGIEFVVRRDNLTKLPKVVEWAAQHGATFGVVTQLMPYEAEQSEQVTYDANTDQAVALFDKWQRIGRQQQLDITTYPHRAWAAGRSQDQRLLSLVEGMKAEARASDLFINVQQLFQRDAEAIDRTTAIFAQAAETARQYGLDLKLPAVMAKQERRCHFVEDGSAFVSWDGKVHPCYNLWHNYHCFINDWKKVVKTKTFGNVNDENILSIWQQREFRTFRENVLRHDYPNCTSCSVAPCDYVEQEEFEQDCYIREEPCGACFWAMGLLQCLS